MWLNWGSEKGVEHIFNPSSQVPFRPHAFDHWTLFCWALGPKCLLLDYKACFEYLLNQTLIRRSEIISGSQAALVILTVQFLFFFFKVSFHRRCVFLWTVSVRSEKHFSQEGDWSTWAFLWARMLLSCEFTVSCWGLWWLYPNFLVYLSTFIGGGWIMALDDLICVISRQNTAPLCCQENVNLFSWISIGKWNDWQSSVCVRAYSFACTCVLIHKYLHKKQQTSLKGRGFRWKGLQAPFKDCSLSFPKIVCTTVCLWHDYFFGGHTILCSSESQKGFREHQSVIWWRLLPGPSFALKSHNHLRYERSLIFYLRSIFL